VYHRAYLLWDGGRSFMGHIRTGRLPDTPAWRRVADLLEGAPFATAGIAAAVAAAADLHLRGFGNDPAFGYTYWLLTRIAAASRGSTFIDDLRDIGLHVDPQSSTLVFIGQVADRVRAESLRTGQSPHLAELGSLALRRALLDTVGTQETSLFGSSLADVQAAFRQHSTRTQFGQLAHLFFADFAGRLLRFVVDRHLPNAIGPEHALQSTSQALAVSDGLERYGRQCARIMQGFAEDWYAKHLWQSGGAITQQQAQGFVAHALRKLRTELKRASTAA
jgi:hypothetical protein